ncbi:class I SAM-dependent methyltransferase [Natronorubrum sp. DTA7]|uniref:class I SAM-dependent methyltransferase n=1 Tax=Natronorubrum sp. DTA7 TaxID=3447016 RepID=UPI003F8723EB
MNFGRDRPFADGAFDGVASSLPFHHVRERARLFRGLRRVLRPGGWLILSVQHPHADFEGGRRRPELPRNGAGTGGVGLVRSGRRRTSVSRSSPRCSRRHWRPVFDSRGFSNRSRRTHIDGRIRTGSTKRLARTSGHRFALPASVAGDRSRSTVGSHIVYHAPSGRLGSSPRAVFVGPLRPADCRLCRPRRASPCSNGFVSEHDRFET